MVRLRFFFFFFPLSVFAMLSGNPGQPALQKNGVIHTLPPFPKDDASLGAPLWWSFRVSFLDDYVYESHFKDEYELLDSVPSNTFIKLSTYASQLTFNIKDRIDFYGILGSSRLQIDKEVFTKRRFAWGVGGKFVMYQTGNFRVGIDGKYFETHQKPTFFVCDDQAFNVVSNFKLKYREIQAAAGMSYEFFAVAAPYVNLTYLISKIEPDPLISLVRLPDIDVLVDVTSKSVMNKKRWGGAVGLTLIDCSKATLAFEWRVFNQNAIDVNAELRF